METHYPSRRPTIQEPAKAKPFHVPTGSTLLARLLAEWPVEACFDCERTVEAHQSVRRRDSGFIPPLGSGNTERSGKSAAEGSVWWNRFDSVVAAAEDPTSTRAQPKQRGTNFGERAHGWNSVRMLS